MIFHNYIQSPPTQEWTLIIMPPFFFLFLPSSFFLPNFKSILLRKKWALYIHTNTYMFFFIDLVFAFKMSVTVKLNWAAWAGFSSFLWRDLCKLTHIWHVVTLTDAWKALKHSRGLSNTALAPGVTTECLTAVQVHRGALRSAQNPFQCQSQLLRQAYWSESSMTDINACKYTTIVIESPNTHSVINSLDCYQAVQYIMNSKKLMN